MSTLPVYHLFEAFGIELEYMIVEAETLSVLPVADKVLREVAGEYVSEADIGDISWSNELALHVIELKTTYPVASLAQLPEKFQQHVRRINGLLEPHNARLMPTAMHPWMDPDREMRLWPHDYSPIYQAYNRIFDCRGHGWANLQSVHLNLPFGDDTEFGRLHAAIRLLLPIMPALSASSPIMEGRATGMLDTRLDVYRTNSIKIPSITGQVVPEAVFSHDEYQQKLLRPMYDDIAPFDPEGILQFEWLNARGAIARFDRNTIEVRVLDVQECPQADVAIVAAISAVLHHLIAERWADWNAQRSIATEPLAALLRATTQDAEQTVIEDAAYLRLFGYPGARCTAGELWGYLLQDQQALPEPAQDYCGEALRVILDHGPLARRILRALDGSKMHAVYGELCECLAEGRMFVA